MATDPARSRDARARRSVQIFDTMGRWVGVLACLITAASALAGLPEVTTAGTATLGAISIVVIKVRRDQRIGSIRNATVIADEILAATDLTEIEDAVRAEIESWPDFELTWCVVAPIVPVEESRVLPHDVARDLRLVLTGVDLADPAPHYAALPVGEAAALTCGRGSDLVLVVKSPSIPDDAAAVFGELAALAGIAARRLEIDEELSARRRSARYEELVRFSSDAIFIVDPVGIIRYAAPSVTAVLGRWSVDLDGADLHDLVVPEQSDDVDVFLANVGLLDARSPTSVALRFVRGDGTEIDGELTGANLLDNPDVRGMVVTVRDVSGRIELERRLRHQAFHDGLTGLANRALFRDRLDRSMRVRRSPGDHAPAVAYLDLDDFKRINDSFGHAAGDQALRTVAERITSCLRGGDTAARLGGDEFAILLEDVPDDRDLVHLLQRVIDAIATPMTVGAETVVSLSASAGVASCEGDQPVADDLLRRADMAMYRAKVRGKNQVARYETAMHQVAHDRSELAGELDQALRDGDIEVHYQPVVDLASGSVVGVEAFVRWASRERGLLAPADFLDIAEDTGLVVPLGATVLDRALADLAAWQELGLDGFVLSVNVSTRQFLHEDFETMVIEGLAAHGLAPSRLQLEITERVLGAGDELAVRRVRSLTAHGVAVALDDFGTGTSSLQTLQALHLSQLKIDRSFVAALGDDGSVVARSIVDLALVLGASSVAEGIERQGELDALRDLGCELGQGNLFGAPVPADSLLPTLVAAQLVSEPRP